MSNAFTVSVAQSPAPVPTRRTVDAFTRTWHALLALSFVGAYVTAESEIFRLVHVSLGYILGGLLVARVVWGCLGPRHARLMALWGKLRGWSDIVEGLRTGQASWRQAQNLCMATSVVMVVPWSLSFSPTAPKMVGCNTFLPVLMNCTKPLTPPA